MSTRKRDQKPDLAAVEAAEAAAQRSVCNVPGGDLPADLAKALERRVAVSIEHVEQTGVLARVGSGDAEVRKLEAPYRKRVARDAKAAAEPRPRKPRGGQHRPAKKATAKKAAAKKTAATPAPTTPEGND